MAHGKVLADGTKEMIFAQSEVLKEAADRPALSDQAVQYAGL